MARPAIESEKSGRLTLSLAPDLIATARARATEQHKPLSRYIADLVKEDQRRHRDELAAAGYRELNAETLEFARESQAAGLGGWPEWAEE